MKNVTSPAIPVAAVAAAAVLAGAGALWGDHVARSGSVAVAAGSASPASVTAECQRLKAALPRTLEGKYWRGTVPRSPQTAAWGSPLTTLRCGVAEPAAVTVGGPDYTPLTNQLVSVDGLNWLVEDSGGQTRFTTTDRAAYVELSVPGDPEHATDALVDLAPVVLAAVPDKNRQFAPDKP